MCVCVMMRDGGGGRELDTPVMVKEVGAMWRGCGYDKGAPRTHEHVSTIGR